VAIFLPIVSKFQDDGINKAVFSISKLGATAANAAAGGLAALGVATVASVKAFADFDAEMTKSLAIMGNVSDSLRDDMSDAAREVAKTTTFSANEAAESYFFLASAGLDAAQSIAALPKVAQFAQAGMFDMATATDLLTDAQSALGQTSDDASENLENMVRLSDVLIKANTLANASVQQFSEALTNKAAASMRSLNIETEEGVAVLAVFADQGIKGSQAGTTFNATIRGLTNGVQRNAEEFARLNVEVFNSQGEMNNMADIVGQLETSLGGLSVEQQRAELTALGFTEETLAGTLALIGNSEAIREYETALGQAAGTTEDVANNQLETLNAQLGLLKSAFVDVGIEIGERLEPTITRLTEETQKLLAEMVASPEFEEFIIQLTAAMEELLPSLIELLPPLTELAIELVPLLIDLIPVLAWVTDFFRVIVEGLTGGMARLDEELGLVFGTAEDGVGITDRIRNAFERFDEAARKLAERIRNAWQELKTFLEYVATGGGNLNVGVPQLAEGGIVTRPTLAMIGEGGESEAVIPLSKMSQFGFGSGGGRGGGGGNITINVTAGIGTDGARVGEAVVKAIKSYERTSGRVFASA
jgi:TP901 family phage tail tape measure protein